MRRTVRKSLTLLALSSLVIAALASWSCGAHDSDTDRDLVGTWQGYEVGGDGALWTFTFTDSAVTVSSETREVYRGRCTMDVSTVPSRADFTVSGSTFRSFVGKTTLAIYDVQGDRLTVAASEPGIPTRPAAFTPGAAARIWTLTRQR